MGVNGQRHAPAALPPGKRPSTHFTGGLGGGATELVWTGAENLAPTGIRSPDRPVSTDAPHATKSDISYIQISSSYRAENTLRVGYKNQSVKVI